MLFIPGGGDGERCFVLGIKDKTFLENLGLQDTLSNSTEQARVFKARCIEKLVQIERDSLREKASQYPSLNCLRVVKELAGPGAPIVSPEIQTNPNKHRWIVMTLLSCPGSLVKRVEGATFCAVCAEPVIDVFSHIIAFCTKILPKFRQNQSLAQLIHAIQSDPESAAPSLIYYLFMSENRFRLQQAYAEIFLWINLH